MLLLFSFLDKPESLKDLAVLTIPKTSDFFFFFLDSGVVHNYIYVKIQHGMKFKLN